MSGTPGPSSVNEMLGSLLSNMTTGHSPSSALGSLLSSIGQPQPTAPGSLLSTSPLPSTSTEVAHPPISPLLLGAGKLLLQNWQPILQVRRSILVISTPLSSFKGRKSTCICWWSSRGCWHCCYSYRGCRGWPCHCRGCQVISD